MFHLLQNSECRIPFEKCQARRKSALKISPEGDFSCLEGLDQTAAGDIFPAAAAVRFVGRYGHQAHCIQPSLALFPWLFTADMRAPSEGCHQQKAV